jgi:hypothetical protein
MPWQSATNVVLAAGATITKIYWWPGQNNMGAQPAFANPVWGINDRLIAFNHGTILEYPGFQKKYLVDIKNTSTIPAKFVLEGGGLT